MTDVLGDNPDSSSETRPRVVIIGGGFAGTQAARALRDEPVRVTLIDSSNHHTFQPLLYQVATAALSPADIAYPIRTIFRKQENCTVILGRALSVDPEGAVVHLDDGSALPFDFAIVAAGALTNYFGNDGWERYGLGLKDVDDALELRRRILLAFEAAERETDDDARRALMTFVVIGGGPTGVEIAGALTELSERVLGDDYKRIRGQKPRIVLIEAQAELLSGGFHPKLGKEAADCLTRMGVDVRLGTRVLDVGPLGVKLADEFIASSTVCWTAGVKAQPIGGTLGAPLDRGGRVIVGSDCSVPGYPNVFVLGDLASFTPKGASRPLPGVAPVAMQMGRYVATAIQATIVGEERRPFKYRDKGSMATIGRSRAVVDTGRFRFSGLFAWMTWLLVHVWYLIGFRNRALVIMQWAWTYVSKSRSACLITGDRAWERAIKLAEGAKHVPPTSLRHVPASAARVPSSAVVPPGSGEAAHSSTRLAAASAATDDAGTPPATRRAAGAA